MRMSYAVLALVLAGCATSSAPSAPSGGDGNLPSDPGSFDDLGAKPTATTGVILGVVVDRGLRPLADVNITLHTQPERITKTTNDGRFAFGNLPGGSYALTASLLNFKDAQTTAEVVVGDAEPKILRIQLEALYSQSPFSVPFDFEGFIECGYSVRNVISYLCVNDYEKLAGGDDIGPTLNGLIDTRGYVQRLDGNWSTIVFELTWEPTATATSPAMFVLVSWWNRTSSDAYGKMGGPPPNVILRFETGETAPGQQGCCDVIPPEGVKDLYPWAGIQDYGDVPVAVGFEQRFHIYQHTFFYGKPPPDWSFVAGDKPPF